MSCIHQLEDSTSKLLNASQYITETAFLVKELIDNSLDAGATCIEIEVSPNAIDIIQVRDNGHGVHPKDVDMLARAACTSKISRYEDLSLLGGRFLGFRGMALSCIAGLSGTMEIYTRVKDEPAGLLLQFSRKGEIISRVLKGGNPGTTVKIQNFLASLEVRRKVVRKEYMKQLAKIRLIVQNYALARPGVRFCFSVLDRGQSSSWEHGGKNNSIVDTARKVFGLSLVSDCMLRHWSSATGFSETEEPDLHLTKGPHFAISALLLKSDIRFGKGNERGQYCSVDSRPIVSSRGTMKKVSNMYRGYLQKALDGEVRNPFFCFNIMCPAGSYDPNIEPAKDNVLFTTEESVLMIMDRFFQAVYGEAIENRAARQSMTSNLLPLSRVDRNPGLVDQITEIADSMAASSFSELTQADEQGSFTRLSPNNSTSHPISLTTEDEFIDISSSACDIDGHPQPFQDGSRHHGHPGRKEDARTSKSANNPSNTMQQLAANLHRSATNEYHYPGQPDGVNPSISHKPAFIPLSRSKQPSSEHALPTPNSLELHSLRPINRPADDDLMEDNTLAPSSIYVSPGEWAKRSAYRGPMDKYLKPSKQAPIHHPSTSHPSSATGTALADIPVHIGRKRKVIHDAQSELQEPGQTTPSKVHPGTNLANPRAQPRVSFAPTFTLSSQNSSNRSILAARPSPRSGLVTPDVSPLKQSWHPPTSLQQSSPSLTASTRVGHSITASHSPPTPTSGKKPLNKKPAIDSVVLRISSTIRKVERGFHTLQRYDGYVAADMKGFPSGFDVSGLSEGDAQDLVCRYGRVLQGLLRTA